MRRKNFKLRTYETSTFWNKKAFEKVFECLVRNKFLKISGEILKVKLRVLKISDIRNEMESIMASAEKVLKHVTANITLIELKK